MSDNKKINEPEVVETKAEAGAAEVSGAPDVVTKEELAVISDRFMVQMSKPYKFEGTTYETIDLSPLQEMTAEDIIAVNRYLERMGIIIASPQPEVTMEVTLATAARATKLPIEFFNGLPLPDAIKVKNRVAGFFYGAE